MCVAYRIRSNHGEAGFGRGGDRKTTRFIDDVVRMILEKIRQFLSTPQLKSVARGE